MKVRFAPSPTGFLHVGGARTAIFNWLEARRTGGTFLLRIEDTDVERSRQQHAEQIIDAMQWLGLDWDEGPIYQSSRLDRYRARVDELLADGRAYRCYCSSEELEAARESAEREGGAFRYPGRCRERTGQEDAPSVVRLRVDVADVVFDDLIRGRVRVGGETLDDFVLLRSDGNPTYHLSVVVDDVDMAVTRVIRGDDHLSNTPKHILLFEAFGAPIPEFAHVPLILGSDRKRLSKRTGATSVEEFRDQGIVPDALFNFLLLLGWSPKGDREIIARDEAVDLFFVGDVHKAPAVFDVEKLHWMNGQYLMAASPGDLVPALPTFIGHPIPDDIDAAELVRLHQPRARTLREMADQITPYVVDDASFAYEDDAVAKHLKGDDLTGRVDRLARFVEALDDWSLEGAESALRSEAEAAGVGAGKLIHPLRIALTGRGASPGIFEVLVLLGRERAIRRVERLRSFVRDRAV